MRTLLIGLTVIFVALPYDAQLALLSPLRMLWLTDSGRMVGLGLLGGAVACLLFYNAIWNQAVRAIYEEDLKKAEESYRRRKR